MKNMLGLEQSIQAYSFSFLNYSIENQNLPSIQISAGWFKLRLGVGIQVSIIFEPTKRQGRMLYIQRLLIQHINIP